jgi:hypothetical protein
VPIILAAGKEVHRPHSPLVWVGAFPHANYKRISEYFKRIQPLLTELSASDRVRVACSNPKAGPLLWLLTIGNYLLFRDVENRRRATITIAYTKQPTETFWHFEIVSLGVLLQTV